VADQHVDERDLDRLWNDLTSKTPPSAPYDLSREAADTIRLFQVLATTPPSDAARERVGLAVMATIERLQNEQTTSHTMNLAVAVPSEPERGILRAVKRMKTWKDWRVTRDRKWAFAQLATAVLLLITFIGIYQVAWDGRLPETGNSSNGAAVPAIVAGCGNANAPVGRSVPISVGTASPVSGARAAVSFVWATTGAPATPEVISHIAFDPQCQLWVMDQLANQFLIFDLNGKLLETWGEPGSGDGQFDFGGSNDVFFGGIAFAPDGGFYVSDVQNRRIQQFDADRQFVRAWGLNGTASTESDHSPWLSWIVVGPDGNVYVTVYTIHGMIQVFSPDGEFIRKFGSGDVGLGRLSRSGPIAFDSAGNLWTVDPRTRTLVQFSPEGEPLARLALPEMGTFSMGLAIDAADRLYVVDLEENTVSVFDPDGTFLYAWGELGLKDGQLLSPFGIALDGAGGVYITDGGSPRIQKFQIRLTTTDPM
jgi:streptogramin lyase